MNAPRHLFAAWPELRGQLARPGRLALFTDFDGTLVRIRGQHTSGRPSARVSRLLQAIAASGALVGVVSGRSLEDLRRRISLRGIWYVGAHGFLLCDPANRRTTLLSLKDERRVARAQRFLDRQLEGVPRVAVEAKGATVAVHHRGASRRSAELARSVVGRALAEDRHLHLMSGKKVWEILPHAEIDKWAAIQLILRRARKRTPTAGHILIYLGDDTTDECVFRKMRGISIVVGKEKRTAARFFLRSPAEVRQFLERVRRSFL